MTQWGALRAPMVQQTRETALALSKPQPEIWRDGHLLVTPRDAALPDRCVKCNRPAEGYRLHKTFYWHSSILYLLAMSPTIIIYAIIALIIRKKCTLEIGLCPMHRRKRVRAAVVSLTLLVLGSVVILIGFQRALNSLDDASTYLVVAGLILLCVGAVLRTYGARVLVAKKADDTHAWYSGVTPEYLRDLPTLS